MDTWGSDSFENDDASDWLADFGNAPAKDLIVNALSRVAEMGVFDCLEAQECTVGIAAAEVVAALRGEPNPNLPSEAKECVSRLTIEADSGLVSLALKAVERIRTDSKLKELWDESENPDEWYAAVDNLEVRLKELDLNALFDVLLDELYAEEAPAEKGSKPVRYRTEAPVESAASIEEVYIDDVFERLRDLIPKPSAAGDKDGTHASAPEFDEDLYQQMKPLFTAIMKHIEKKAT